MSTIKLTGRFQGLNASEIVKRIGLGENGMVQCFIDSETLRRCKPYVPFDTGALQRSGDAMTAIGNGEVRYGTPYAARWYYNVPFVDRLGRHCSPATFQGAPMRGSHWFERMKNEGGADLIGQGAAALAGGRFEK